NNNVERVGSPWSGSSTNYTTALYFINPSKVRTLMLPAAGFRSISNGELGSRGSFGYYWSSSETTSIANYLSFASSSVFVSNNSRAFGFSVRCVAE
ncbi:TPA: hypothetical protein ACGZ96_002332, partial [Elizabethkingia anophelis]